MNGNTDKDKQLLENLDRILGGNDGEATEPGDEDTRSAVEFARKMANMREEPSEEFTKDLKARLVHRLAEQERGQYPDDTELTFWGIPRRKLWQGTLAALITLIILAVVFIIMMVMSRAG